MIIEHGCIPITLEDVLEKSRFVFVMAGVTKDNRGFLSAEKLSLIKKDSFFILMSRAAVVDFDALCSLTEEGTRSFVKAFPRNPNPIIPTSEPDNSTESRQPSARYFSFPLLTLLSSLAMKKLPVMK